MYINTLITSLIDCMWCISGVKLISIPGWPRDFTEPSNPFGTSLSPDKISGWSSATVVPFTYTQSNKFWPHSEFWIINFLITSFLTFCLVSTRFVSIGGHWISSLALACLSPWNFLFVCQLTVLSELISLQPHKTRLDPFPHGELRERNALLYLGGLHWGRCGGKRGLFCSGGRNRRWCKNWKILQ